MTGTRYLRTILAGTVSVFALANAVRGATQQYGEMVGGSADPVDW